MKDLAGLFARIADYRPDDAWPSLDKMQTMAAAIVGLRPRFVVELGVWDGNSLIPQLLALRHVGFGSAVAIDAWSADASIDGQVDPRNVEWWGRQEIHEAALARFIDRMARYGVSDLCRVIRARSDDVDPAEIIGDGGAIDLLHCDSNHGDVAIREIDRFGRRVSIGGLLVMDDLQWSGGSVLRARDRAIDLGFVERYPLGTGVVLQRARA